MGKRYDQNVTPQNTPHFRKRRLLFVAAMGIFVLNLILSGIFVSQNTLWFIIVALVFLGFTVVQCFDKRAEMWTWGYILSWILFSFIASAVIFIAYKAYWWLIAFAIELTLFSLLYKKTFKRVRRRATNAAQE